MLIGICGGPCAGKNSVQNYLIQRHAFIPLTLARDTVPSAKEDHPFDHYGLPEATAFTTVDDLLGHVTRDWQTNYVTTSIHSERVVDALSARPFFILVYVDAPITIRWQRIQTRCTQTSQTPPTLEQFVLRNDRNLYDPATALAAVATRAQIKILNAAPSLLALHKFLDSLNLPNPALLRPSWDQYFMMLAGLAARRSNCMRRQVGCVLVRAHRVISTGYNGTPRHLPNCNEGGCPRCNSGPAAVAGGAALATCLCLHAEENALLEAGRERVGDAAVIYCNTCPCLTCAIKIAQVGITEVVYSRSYYMDDAAAEVLKKAGVHLRQFSLPPEGLVGLSNGRC